MKPTIEQWIKEKNLINTGDRVLVAASGGPDSMALLHLLKGWEKAWGLQVMAAHVNHGLRTETAVEDERFVQRWCEEKDIPFFSTYVAVEKEMTEYGGSVQGQARRLRYNYLAELMQEQDIHVLATGHHADDQIETILMKQASGRAVLGDVAMRSIRRFKNRLLVRPLLAVTKEDILDYCKEHGISFQQDESNLSDKYTRNRFRHYMLPFLKEEDARVHEHFQQYADWLTEERDYIESQAEKEWASRIIKQNENSVTISTKGMETLPLPLQRRGIHLILKYICVNQIPELSVVHINQFLYLLHQNHSSATLDWPGNISVTQSYDTITFAVKNIDEGVKTIEPAVLSIPGQTLFAGAAFSAQYLQDETLLEGEGKEHVLVCRSDDLTFPLTIRPRLPGDKIQPLGMKGSKKVNRIFIEKKIPIEQRLNWPVVVDAVGNVLWVPLLKKSIWSSSDLQASDNVLIVMECTGFSEDENGV
ncbi:tRNA lysidine(34) synthetase TilS [Salibacterium salarium]|uniref:tRNA(Ile)-lysidine synthase n=1 Tax=Salibacterium salarium TaxID=284579 RepID=A0A428MV82_9BACI|nr:tRNA lysidine(34) synthetase TilS [Salibacterium salarium]RSL30050.1 tRNA lysidine(34) synthetase TilS [Salibacterium salarium]